MTEKEYREHPAVSRSELLKTNFIPFEVEILNSAYDGRNLE